LLTAWQATPSISPGASFPKSQTALRCHAVVTSRTAGVERKRWTFNFWSAG